MWIREARRYVAFPSSLFARSSSGISQTISPAWATAREPARRLARSRLVGGSRLLMRLGCGGGNPNSARTSAIGVCARTRILLSIRASRSAPDPSAVGAIVVRSAFKTRTQHSSTSCAAARILSAFSCSSALQRSPAARSQSRPRETAERWLNATRPQSRRRTSEPSRSRCTGRGCSPCCSVQK